MELLNLIPGSFFVWPLFNWFNSQYCRDAMDSQQLADNGIRAIVSVHGLSKDCQFGPGIAVFRVMLNDASGENVARHFGPVNSFIHGHRLEHGGIQKNFGHLMWKLG